MPTIQETIAAALKELSPRVESEVVEAIADRKVKENVDILVKCVDLLTAEEGALKKLERPDNVQFDTTTGKEVSSTYSKTRWDEIKKKRERIDKIKKAIDKGLTGDIGDAKQLSSGKAPTENKTGDGEKDDTDSAG